MTTAVTAERRPTRRPSLRSDDDRNALVTANINLVYGCLRRRFPSLVDDDDVAQAGRLGLIRAAELYDPTRLNRQTGKPYTFSTYAENWMRQCIMDELRNRGVIHVPHYPNNPYRAEVARARRVLSFTQVFDGGGDYYAAREPSDDDDNRAEMEERLRWAMERLPLADAAFLEERYFGRVTIMQMAAKRGVSKQRVRQVQGKVLRRLNRVLHERGLFDCVEAC
jgi:RNA polymerase sigma factor (sigma-70 family)